MLVAYTAARVPDSSPLVGRLFSRATAPETVYALPGSCLFFPALALERIGLLDEHTFLYFEELIAAERLARAGLRCVFVPASVVYHKRGQSTARLGARSFAEGSRSQRYYLTAYLDLPRWQWRLLDLIRAGVYVARSARDASYRAGLGAYLREVWR
jgi:GT2 family glycosyltransferase